MCGRTPATVKVGLFLRFVGAASPYLPIGRPRVRQPQNIASSPFPVPLLTAAQQSALVVVPHRSSLVRLLGGVRFVHGLFTAGACTGRPAQVLLRGPASAHSQLACRGPRALGRSGAWSAMEWRWMRALESLSFPLSSTQLPGMGSPHVLLSAALMLRACAACL